MQDVAPVTLIVGLGNPGNEYLHTRHNAGFEVIDSLLTALPGTFEETHICDSKCYIGRFRGRTLILQKPLTFMNLSGLAVAGFSRKRNIPTAEILAIHDDLDLPLGRIRIRRGGGAGGHHGVESMIAELGGAGFSRIRIGIGHDEAGHTVDHVLGAVSASERPQWEQSIAAATEAVPEILSRGIERAMTRFNQAPECGGEKKQ